MAIPCFLNCTFRLQTYAFYCKFVTLWVNCSSLWAATIFQSRKKFIEFRKHSVGLNSKNHKMMISKYSSFIYFHIYPSALVLNTINFSAEQSLYLTIHEYAFFVVILILFHPILIHFSTLFVSWPNNIRLWTLCHKQLISVYQ